MTCKHCDKTISAEAKFCRHCGGMQTAAIAPEQSPPRVEHKDAVGERRYAGYWIRLQAFTVDFALILLVFAVIAVIIGDKSYDELVVKQANFVLYGAFVLYNIFFLFTWSKTPGKALFGLTVVNSEKLSDISLGTSIGRSLLQIVSTLFFFAGYWNMGSDKRKQAFHDKHAHTVVVQEKKGLWIATTLAAIATVFLIWLCFLSS